MNKREECDKLIENYICPECDSALYITWSPCYDSECCGISDSINCDGPCGDDIECYISDTEYLEQVLKDKGIMPKKKPMITIEDVKRLVLKRGEVLLIRLPDTSTSEQVHNFVRGLRQGFDGVMEGKVFVYRGEVEFTVLEFEAKKDDSNYCGAV